MASSTSQISGNIGLPKVFVSTDGGSVYNQILQLVDITDPETVVDDYENTHTDLTDGFKTYLQGWKDGGEAAWVFNYREDSYSQLLALSGTDDWRVTWTDPGHTSTDPKLEFEGHISAGPTIDKQVQDKWTLNVTIKLDGGKTFTEGTT